VLAEVIGRDGTELSASQTWQQALAGADHLAVLHAAWTAETTSAREQRSRELLMAALPPGQRQEPSHRKQWLWRTLRAAELAGLDARQVLAEAVGERDLTCARDIPAAIDSRIRRRTGALVPLPAPRPVRAASRDRRPGAPRLSHSARRFMDARRERIGEHAAAHALPWTVGALGPVPADPAEPPRCDYPPCRLCFPEDGHA
jgi:hypothetical protein